MLFNNAIQLPQNHFSCNNNLPYYILILHFDLNDLFLHKFKSLIQIVLANKNNFLIQSLLPYHFYLNRLPFRNILMLWQVDFFHT